MCSELDGTGARFSHSFNDTHHLPQHTEAQ